jgi:hypothetical protein
VRATLEADAESRLKETQSVTEAIEAAERRKIAEEAAMEVLQGKMRMLEQTCGQLQEDNASLRFQLQARELTELVVRTPRRDAPERLAQKERILWLREELAVAEAEVAAVPVVDSRRPSRVEVPKLAMEELDRRHTVAVSKPSVMNGLAAHERIKELEREMAAVHKDSLTIDGVQRGPYQRDQLHCSEALQAAAVAASAAASGMESLARRRHSTPGGGLCRATLSEPASRRNHSKGRSPMNGPVSTRNGFHMSPSRSKSPPPASLSDQLELAGDLTAQMRELAAEWRSA